MQRYSQPLALTSPRSAAPPPPTSLDSNYMQMQMLHQPATGGATGCWLLGDCDTQLVLAKRQWLAACWVGEQKLVVAV